MCCTRLTGNTRCKKSHSAHHRTTLSSYVFAIKAYIDTTPAHHKRFTALFLGQPGWAGARSKLLDFIVQGKINRGRHTFYPAGHHSIQTNHCPLPLSPHIFYRPDALPVAQPTVSKHWRQSTIGKILVKQQYLLHMSHNKVNFGPLTTEINWQV